MLATSTVIGIIQNINTFASTTCLSILAPSSTLPTIKTINHNINTHSPATVRPWTSSCPANPRKLITRHGKSLSTAQSHEQCHHCPYEYDDEEEGLVIHCKVDNIYVCFSFPLFFFFGMFW